MEAKLVIENFGPIVDRLELDIKKFNIFIGPQGSGKSTISKVFCVIHSFMVEYHARASLTNGVVEKKNIFIKLLSAYQISSFLNQNSYLFFEDVKFKFEMKGENVTAAPKTNNVDLLLNIESYYFPAERIALPMINDALFELVRNDSTLPKHFLDFGKDFTLAKKKNETFTIPVLDIQFEHSEGRDSVKLNNDTELSLQETSSAIQAILPMLLVLQDASKPASAAVIEELELHCYPLLQKKLLHHIVRVMKYNAWSNSYVILPTHSPYLLGAINNLILAERIGNQDLGLPNDESYTVANKIIPSGSWISKEKLAAFYIENGKATSIINADGLIDENELDTISEDLADEFNALMSLYKPARV